MNIKFSQFLKTVSLSVLLALVAKTAQAQDGSVNNATLNALAFSSGSYITSIGVLSDGDMIVAGTFTSYDGTTYNRIIRLDPDGSVDSDTNFNTNMGTGFDGDVNDLKVLTGDQLLIGGAFANYGSTGMNNVIILNPDGTVDTGFDPGTNLDGEIYSVNIDANNKILIGGAFANYGATSIAGIARLNTDGTLDTNFNNGGDGIYGTGYTVYDIEIQSDDKIIVGGAFDGYNDGSDNSSNGLVRLNANGAFDNTFDVGTGLSSGYIIDVALNESEELVIGGAFTSYNGTSRNSIAMVDTDGSLLTSFAPATDLNGAVFSIGITSDNMIVFGGAFDTYSTQNVDGLVKVSQDGTGDSTFDTSGLGTNSQINKVVIKSESEILIGGGFTSPENNLAIITNSNLYIVTITNDSGSGSLRWCIDNANLSSGETISFNIPGVGPWTISPTTNLPQITSTTIIDAPTQPGWSSSNLVGISKGGATIGLDVNANDVEIYGLEITGFNSGGETAIYVRSGVVGGIVGDIGRGNVIGDNYYGIRLSGSNYLIKSNKVGTGNSGTTANANYAGIYMSGGGSNQVGGDNTLGEGNLVSGNSLWGIRIINSNDNIIQGNYVGTDITGYNALANDYGIVIGWGTGNESTGNTIGGTGTGEGNLISGNTNSGLRFLTGSSNMVYGNIIGLDKDGLIAIPNSTGIDMGFTNSYPANNNTIGGSASGGPNTIAGNTNHNIVIYNGSGNTIQGNNIGVDINGDPLSATTTYGIRLVGFSTSPVVDNNIIGGTAAGEGNIIASHTNYGIYIDPGSGTADGNTIRGNEIYCNAIAGVQFLTGANNNIVAPVVTDYDTGTGTVNGTCSTCLTGDLIDVYRDNSGCSPGQGDEYLGTVVFSTSPWSLTGLTLSANDIITTTVTDGSGNTSQFSTTDPEIEVYDGVDNTGTLLIDGLSTVDAGFEFVGTDLVRSVTIENLGMVILDISSIITSNSNFTITGTPSTIAFNASATFTVSLVSQPVGNYNTTITINNDDPDEDPFTFTISAVITGPDFYSLGSSTFDDPNNWQTAQGVNPPDFTDPSHNFIIQNGHVVSVPSSAINIGDLTIQSGGTMQYGSQLITVNGNTSVEGDLVAVAGNGSNAALSNNFIGTFTVESTGSVQNTSYRVDFHFEGDITNRGTFSLQNSTHYYFDALLTISNESNSIMMFASTNSGFARINADVIIEDGGGGTILLNSTGQMSLADNITITNRIGNYPDVTRYLRIPKMSATVGATFLNDANAVARFNPNDGTLGNNITYDLAASDNMFVYDSNIGSQEVITSTYYHVNFTNGSTTNTLQGDITVNGNLTIGGSAVLDADVNNISVVGDWINNHGTAGFVPGSRNVGLVGPTDQSITGDTDFSSLIINKTGGNVTANDSVSVSALLSLANDAQLILNNSVLSIRESANITGTFSSSRMIDAADGKVVKYFNATGSFTYPIGTGSSYTPAVITLNSSIFSGTDYIAVTPVAAEAPNVLTSGYALQRYWDVSMAGLTSVNAEVVLSYLDTDVPLTATEASFLAALYNSYWTIGTTSDVDESANSVTFSGISDLNANFTAGEASAFINITYTDLSISTSNMFRNSTSNVLYRFQLNSDANVDFTGLTFATSGTYVASDLNGSGIKLYYNSSNTLSGATQFGSGLTGAGTFSGTLSMAAGSDYFFFITADISGTAVHSNTITVTSVTPEFSAGSISVTPTVGTVQSINVPTLGTAVASSNGLSGAFDNVGYFYGEINTYISKWDRDLVKNFSSTVASGLIRGVAIDHLNGEIHVGLKSAKYRITDGMLVGSTNNFARTAVIDASGGVIYTQNADQNLYRNGAVYVSAATFDTYVTSNNVRGLFLSGNTLWVGTDNARLHKIDISDLVNPVLLQSFDAASAGNFLTFTGNFEDITGGDKSLLYIASRGTSRILAFNTETEVMNEMLAPGFTPIVLTMGPNGEMVVSNFTSQYVPIENLLDSRSDMGTPPTATFGGGLSGTSILYAAATDQILTRFSITPSIADAALYEFKATANFTGVAGIGDLSNYKLWFKSDDSNFLGGTQIAGTVISTSGNDISISGINQHIDVSTAGYFWLTADVAHSSPGTIQVDPASLVTNDTYVHGVKAGTITNTPVIQLMDALSVEPEIEVLSGTTNLTSGATTVDFGTGNIGTDILQTFTINNIGTSDLTIIGYGFADGSKYSTASTSTTVAAGSSTTFDVLLDGSLIGVFTDQLTVISDDLDESFFVIDLIGQILTGQDIVVHSGGVSLISTVSTIDFEITEQGTNTTQTITIENAGTDDLIITTIILADGTIFSLEGLSFPITLAPGETLDVSITLNADNIGSFTDTITIVSNDLDNGNFEIGLMGDVTVVPVPDIEVQSQSSSLPGVVEFGTVKEGNDMVLTFDILNNGNADLQVISIVSSNSEFAISSITLPATIVSLGSAAFDVTMNTDSTGVFESMISITSNDPDQNPYSFNVRGVVEGARVVVIITNPDNSVDRVVVSNDDIDMGQTTINQNIEKVFGIENLSDSETITVNSITVDNPAFEIIDVPSSIPAGDFAPFTVLLIAKNIGIHRGTVTVSTSLNDFSFIVVGQVLPTDDPPLNIYNIITPNGDGMHDFFKVGNIGYYDNNAVTIFDRWGNKVFEISGYDNLERMFTGTSNIGGSNDLDTGNYYYVIDKGNGSEKTAGYLFIKR